MLNWLKRLWKDSGDLSKPQFFQKYLLPALALFFTWGLVGHLVLINLDPNSLLQNTGEVAEIEIKFEQGTKANYKYYPLIISLTNYPEEFRLPDTYKRDFAYLQEIILVGDTITLFTRQKWQSLLGWGKLLDIYEIDKNGQTLFGLSEVISETKSQATIFTVFSIILWPWYIFYRRTRNDNGQDSR